MASTSAEGNTVYPPLNETTSKKPNPDMEKVLDFLHLIIWRKEANPHSDLISDDIFERSIRNPYLWNFWNIEGTRHDVVDWPSLGELKEVENPEDFPAPDGETFISEMTEVDNVAIKKLLLAKNGLTEVPNFESVDEVILFWSRQGNPLDEYNLAKNNTISEDTLVELLMEGFKTTDTDEPCGDILLHKGRISTKNFIKLVDEGKLGTEYIREPEGDEKVPEEVLIRWKNEGKDLDWMSLYRNLENYNDEEFKQDIKEGYLRYLANNYAFSKLAATPCNALEFEDVD